MPHKFHRHKVLLDEGFPLAIYFPRLKGRHDVKHVITDYKKGGAKDDKLYELAKKEKRIIITYNDKDFIGFASGSKNAGVIGVSTNLPLEQIDKKLTSLLNNCTENDLYGKFKYISGETNRK